MDPLPRTRSCLVCGCENPLGHRLRMESDGRRVRACFRFRPEHTGFRDVVHGGATATVLDELMAWAVGVVARRFAFCAELNVRYRRPVSANADLTGWGEVTADRRGKVFETRAWLEDAAGTLLAEASGRYMPLDRQVQAAMLEDFVEDPKRWIGDPPSGTSG